MSRRKQQPPNAAATLAQVKAIVSSEHSTVEMRQQAVQIAYEIGASEGRLAGALAAVERLGLPQ